VETEVDEKPGKNKAGNERPLQNGKEVGKVHAVGRFSVFSMQF
jgi:hypothetical protein